MKERLERKMDSEERLAPVEPTIDPGEDITFDTKLLEQVSGIAESGVGAAQALILIGRLIGNIPEASKGQMDKIKLMDKLINSARHMIETKLKTDDLAAVMRRLDEMEDQIDASMTSDSASFRPDAGDFEQED